MSEATETAEAGEATDVVDATPDAVALAATEGIDLSTVEGTGADDRVTLNDVRKAARVNDERAEYVVLGKQAFRGHAPREQFKALADDPQIVRAIERGSIGKVS